MDALNVGPGELVALDLPPSDHLLDTIERLWRAGVAFLPLDQRHTLKERRLILDRAQPTAIMSPEGETVFVGGPTTDPSVGCVVATSGTAGAPKLAELSREAIGSALELSNRVAGIDPGDPWVACLDPSHIGGLLVYLRRPLFGTPVMVLEWDGGATALRGSHVSLVPAMLRRSLARAADLSGLGTLLVGGADLDGDDRRAAESLGGRVISTYGLTETCGGISYDGRLFEGTEARIVERGRIELRGPTLMEGYRNDPAATGAAFSTDGWLLTTDGGVIHEDGSLRVLGRLDDAIRTGAETVWPQEVEAALRDHPKVAEVAIAGRPHPDWGQQVAAFVVPARIDDPPTLEELRDHASRRIARFKAPGALVLAAELPRTASGKLRRSALGELSG